MDIKISHKSSVNKDKKKKPKRRWTHWLLEIMIVLIILVGIRIWQQHGMISGEAPDIMLPDLSGKVVQLEDFKGEPVLLHFWATWCKVCKFEESWINSVGKDWKVLSVVTLSTESDDDIRRYMKNNNIEHWQTVVDRKSTLAEHYGIKAVPSTFVIDSNGEIRFKEVGITTPWGWRFRLWLTDLVDG